MSKIKYVDTQIREQWIVDHFQKDPTISGPKMMKMVKDKFKQSMRAVRVYELRDGVLKTLGWKKDGSGHPVPPHGEVATKGVPVTTAHFVEQAHRAGVETVQTGFIVDPLIGRCVVPCEDVTDGVSFQQKIAFMNEKGFLTPKVKVEAVTDSYIILKKE